MVDKQILWDQLGSYEEKMADLQSQIGEMNTERREWIDKNRKNIRDHLMPKHGCFYELILPSPVEQWNSPRRLSIYTQEDRTGYLDTKGTYVDGEIKNFSFEGCCECCFYGFDCTSGAYRYGEKVITHFDDNEPILPRYIKISDGKLYNTLHKEHRQNYPQIKGFLLDRNFEPLPYGSGSDYGRICITHLGERVTKEKSSCVKPTNIYVMIDKNTGLYKIGRSTNPTYREQTLQSEKPTIELLFHNSGVYHDETTLHRKFVDKRVRGEWFKLDADDLSAVKDYFTDKEDNGE